MKKTLICLLCVLSFTVFTACDNHNTLSSDNDAAQVSSSAENEFPENDNEDDNAQIPYESITDISVLDDGFYSVFTATNPDDSENQLYGIVDGNGQVVFGPVSNYMFPCNGHKTAGIYTYNDDAERDYKLPFYLGNGYYVTEHSGHGLSDFVCYVYHDFLEREYAVYQNEGGVHIAEVFAIPDDTLYFVCEDSIKGIKKIQNPTEVLKSYIDETGHWNYTPTRYRYNLSLTGEELVLEGYEYASPEVINGYIIAQKGGKYGYINAEGKEVTEFVYDEARVPFYDKAWVKKDGKWQIEDLTQY